MNPCRLILPLALAALLARADDDDKKPDPEVLKAAVAKLVGSLKPRQGEVDLHSGLAKARVPAEFNYLGPEDAEKVLVRLWGNPPMRQRPLGLIYPAAENLAGENGWAIIIQYDEDGHIKDDDAKTIDYAKLLKEMQTGTRRANEERTKQGYPTVELVGWAAPPRYDAEAHKLYWAKEVSFADSPQHTLNYNLRVLGRKGVLILNAVSPMTRLKDIEAATPQILAMVDFTPGNRYADFDKRTDKVATYGLAALVAGGIAAKAGLFKGLLVALLAAKKFIVVALVAAAGFIKRLFTGKRKTPPVEPQEPGGPLRL